jgi:NAD(P)-dependent dehydrogenase (short-subunit alcohol dehydrogenase family)
LWAPTRRASRERSAKIEGRGEIYRRYLKQVEAAVSRSRWICTFGDLRDPGDCDRVAAEAARALGSIDGLVNNARYRTMATGLHSGTSNAANDAPSS